MLEINNINNNSSNNGNSSSNNINTNNGIKVKVLEKITVNGYVTKLPEKVRVAYCKEDNNYYLLEDYVADADVNTKEISFVLDPTRIWLVEVNNRSEVYKLYVSSFLVNDLNPFLILSRYKQGYEMPDSISRLLKRNVSIPDDLLEQLNQDLIKKCNTNKRIVINLDILDAIRWCYETYIKNRELLEKNKITLVDFINTIIDEDDEKIVYPTELMLIVSLDHFIIELKRKIERERDKDKDKDKERGIEGADDKEGKDEEVKRKVTVVELTNRQTVIPAKNEYEYDYEYENYQDQDQDQDQETPLFQDLQGSSESILGVSNNDNDALPDIYVDIQVKNGWLNINLTTAVDFELTDDLKKILKVELTNSLARFLRRIQV